VEAVLRQRLGEDSVSSVVGTILMLAVTVTVFGGLSIVVLNEVRSTESPPDADVAFVNDGTRAVLAHRGGEPILLTSGFLILNVAGAEVRYDLTAVADQTADGRYWRIGETLCLSGPSPPDPARPCLLQEQTVLGAAVVAGGGLLADEGERGGDAGPCPLDNAAPTVPGPWTFDPANVLSTTTGPVTVRFTATDDCSGMDDAVAPQMVYRINDGSDPAFSPMTSITNEGPGAWSGVVPAQSWNLLGGQSLDVRASGLADANGNVAGDTAVVTEPIGVVTLVRTVTAATATTGTADPLSAAQDGENDNPMVVTEAGTVGPAGSVGPTKFSGTTVVNSGAVNPNNVLSSNDVRADLDTGGDYVDVSGFDLPSEATGVTSISIGYEGRKASGQAPTTRLDYKIGGGSFVTNLATIPETSTSDADKTRTLTGTFSVADVEAMTVRLSRIGSTGGNPQVDHVFVSVTYSTAPVTTYSLDLTLDFAGTSDGASETLKLRYKTSGDTFEVQVWDALASAYVSRGTLSSASYATFDYTLVDNGVIDEYNGGSPRVRIIDLTPSGTTAGTLDLDSARMETV
jgi:FlaG/FlaF family flagellin (archaellin)